PPHGLERHWGWLIGLGVLLIVVGMAAIMFPVISTLTSMQVFGVLLLMGAGIQFASAIWALRWGGFFLHLCTGLLYLFIGIVVIDHPLLSAEAYTIMLAVFFVAGGIIRIALAISGRFVGWGWALTSGIITLILGILIWRQLPDSALWVVGTFIGIDLLFVGW